MEIMSIVFLGPATSKKQGKMLLMERIEMPSERLPINGGDNPRFHFRGYAVCQTFVSGPDINGY